MMKDLSKLLACISLLSTFSVNLIPGGLAQMPGPEAQGPIDITANEQEFAGETVIARGNVKVVYKGSIILAPAATLFKDPEGNPSRAIFTGHPRLTKGTNKMDAETMTFEIGSQKILAKGNAHSEVESGGTDDGLTPAAPVASAKKPATNVDNEDSESSENKAKPVVLTKKPETKPSNKPADTPVEHIITDADMQEYDSETGKFDAFGHVRVKHGDITVLSNNLRLVYGTNNKPETAIFTGNVTATQNRNSTCADTITYSLTTRRLQATGNVKSKVIQENKTAPLKKVIPVAQQMGDLLAPAAKALTSASKSVNLSSTSETGEAEKPIFILSDSQDYSKDTGRLTAHGSVKMIYGDTRGIGPAIIMVKNAEGKAEKIVFKGRSQITQPGKRWIADSIVFIIAEHKVIAQGNAKAMILQNNAEPEKAAPTVNNSRMASRPDSNRSLSASKVDKTQ